MLYFLIFIFIFCSVAALSYHFLFSTITFVKEKNFINAIDSVFGVMITILVFIALIYFTINFGEWKFNLGPLVLSFTIARIIFALKELLWQHYLLQKKQLIKTDELGKIPFEILDLFYRFQQNKENNTKFIEKNKKSIIRNAILLFVLFFITWFIFLQIPYTMDKKNYNLAVAFLEILYYLLIIPALIKKSILFKNEISKN